MHIRTLTALEVGREYTASLSDDGEVVLLPTSNKGRPRRLSADEVIAARALRSLDFTLRRITAILNEKHSGDMFDTQVSVQAIRTALGS